MQENLKTRVVLLKSRDKKKNEASQKDIACTH